MKINIKYSGKILNLPASVAECITDASREELCVIIGLFNSVEYLDAFDKYLEPFSEKIGIGIERIKRALKFWEDKGVISLDGAFEDVIITSASSSMPSYSGEQIARFMEKNKGMNSLFTACQSIMGKELSTPDFNHILFLKQHYGFGDEFITLLVAHCTEIDKANWAYIKRTAQNLYDEGVDTYFELEKHFAARKNKRSLEYKVRELFGIGKRELSKKEKEKIEPWLSEALDIELIRHAYNITIDKTGKPSLAYCAKIIETWHAKGLRTLKDVEASKASVATPHGSFDTDDFFEAALQRSYNKKKGEN